MPLRPAALLLLLAPTLAPAQAKDPAKVATLEYLRSLEVLGGGFRADADAAKPNLRATGAAVRAWKYTATFPRFPLRLKDKHAAFVLACYDPATGGFADAPGGKPDAMLTASGVMTAIELDIPKAKFARAMDYLREHAKSFEEVRLAAGAVEAWRVADCPFDLKPWFDVVAAVKPEEFKDPHEGGARMVGSVAAFYLRLGEPLPDEMETVNAIRAGQRKDYGWGEAGTKESDLGSTYRVVRALYLLKTPPLRVREFVQSCRNPDGGYGVAPGRPSSAAGTYYAAIITKWLNELGN